MWNEMQSWGMAEIFFTANRWIVWFEAQWDGEAFTEFAFNRSNLQKGAVKYMAATSA